jgi:hypothetical protein
MKGRTGMKRKSFLIATFLLPVFILGACISVFVPVPTPTFAPTPIILPTNPPPPVEPPPTSIQSAPMCAADPLAAVCAPPIVEELARECTKKIPYTYLVMPPGSTWQPAQEGLTCRDEERTSVV